MSSAFCRGTQARTWAVLFVIPKAISHIFLNKYTLKNWIYNIFKKDETFYWLVTVLYISLAINSPSTSILFYHYVRYDDILISYLRKYTMMDKRKRSLLKGAKDEIELDRMNKHKQGKVISLLKEIQLS